MSNLDWVIVAAAVVVVVGLGWAFFTQKPAANSEEDYDRRQY